jgi:hypothetical protein
MGDEPCDLRFDLISRVISLAAAGWGSGSLPSS